MKVGLRNTKKVVRVDFGIFVFGAIYSALKVRKLRKRPFWPFFDKLDKLKCLLFVFYDVRNTSIEIFQIA